MEVAEISNVHPDTLRDWRHRGLISTFGDLQPNGRWLYSVREAVALYLGWRLIVEAKVERAEALRIGFEVAPDLITAIRGDGPWRHYRASVFTVDASSTGWSVRRLDDLAEIRNAILVTNVLNIAALAAAAPREVREAVEA